MSFARRVRRITCIILAAVSLGAGMTAAASGHREKAPFLSVSAPETARPGDTVPVSVHYSGKRDITTVLLRDEDGNETACIPFFTVDSSNRSLTVKGALIPVSITAKPGVYTLEIPGKESIESLPLVIHEREFISETIPLNEANTAIKTNNSKKRTKQIKKLSSILLSVSSDAPFFPGPYAIPVTAQRRTAGFGDQRLYKYSDGNTQRNTHYGIDFGIPTGTPVYACGDGRVVLAEHRITTGWTVVIEHMPGVYSLYYHLDSLSTAEGETVRTGTLIGKSGCTGLSTGPHLHWELRVNGEAVDPDLFIGRTFF